MRYAVVFVFLFIGDLLSAQVTRCEVKQYFGTDSLNATFAKIITYNSCGQMITEQYIGWKKNEQEESPDGTFTYIYNDTFLTRWIYGSAIGDSSRTEFTYDAGGKLTQQSFFELKEIGGRGPGDAHLDPQQLPLRWVQTSIVNFSYDEKGRKILYDATRLHYTPQNMYKWEYDDQGRVIKQESYSRGKLTWKEDYQYFDWGYRYWRTWYDFEGNMRHEFSTETPQYYPLLFFACKMDKQGRIIEERIVNEKQVLQGRTTTHYNTQGRIVRTVNYNANDKPAVTHVYIYK